MSEIDLSQLYNLTTLTEFLNINYKSKKTGKPFTTTDVQFYIKRGYLPDYLGGDIIKLVSEKLKLYKLIKKL
jgi:hypothetical protein